MRVTLIYILLICSGSLFAQEPSVSFSKETDLLPPPPNAAAIIKYGNSTINKNTGAASINIPMYTLKGNKLSTSVSLGYSSNGIKVDEIASRVGMGWALTAGGVVTRTVRGQPDERNNVPHHPYAAVGLNWSTYNYMQRVSNNTTESYGFDSEPDLFSFSFDGYSGSFVYDGNGNIVMINKSGLKILKDLNDNATWNFKIITPDGTTYIFGGPEATEKIKRTNSCGKTYTIYLPSSWYLKEIKSLNGESILFNYIPHTYSYDNGVTQTMQHPGLFGLSEGCVCPQIPPSTCVNTVNTQGVLLSSIESVNNSKIEFGYMNRQDCGDMLLNKVTLKDPVNILSSYDLIYDQVQTTGYINQILLGHDKTPFLAQLTENSSDNLQHRKHYFSYITPQARAPRLSYAQDHWGFFNGKPNNTLIPDLGILYHANFPNATADRNPDFQFGKRGLLEKIVYPTGGIEMIEYEAHKMENTWQSITTEHRLNCNVTGTGFSTEQTKVKSFSTIGQNVQLQVNIELLPGTTPTQHNVGKVEILTSTGSLVYSTTYQNPGIYNFSTFISSGNYLLKLYAGGQAITTSATLIYAPENHVAASPVITIGGARVNRIISGTPTQMPISKTYLYTSLDNLGGSSLNTVANPQYVGLAGGGSGNCNNNEPFNCENTSLSSNSLFNLGFYGGTLISYHAIIERIGEDFSKGATETKFLSGNDNMGMLLWNKPITNSTFSNTSALYNGKIMRETHVKQLQGGSFLPIKKTDYLYEDFGNNDYVDGYVVNNLFPTNNTFLYDTTCYSSTGWNSCISQLTKALKQYNMVKYRIYSTWVNPKTVTETTYDENGGNPQQTVKNYFYENTVNYSLTRVEEVNSENQLILTKLNYPNNYTNLPVYASMVTSNVIGPVINVSKEKKINNISIPIEVLKTNYNVFGSNFLPTSFEKSFKGNSFVAEGIINFFDEFGNVLQVTTKAGIVKSYIWGYNKRYPVAEITNASHAGALAQLTVSITALQSLNDQALLTELNRIRTNLPAAQVISYTYKPLVGVTSVTDINNNKSSYEYDSFGQLILIRDNDGNILKKNEYSYTTPISSAQFTSYDNDFQSQVINCTTCAPGYTSSPYTYTVPVGKYVSYISQADANSKAIEEINLLAQDYVNKISVCINGGVCNGVQYKFINCICEPGEKTCQGTYTNGNGQLMVQYRYKWSDQSLSGLYEEPAPSCNSQDQKFLNCECEPGDKICVSLVNNGGGSYTSTYYYRWSDNSVSPNYSETFSCTGVDKKMIGCDCKTAQRINISSQYCPKNSGIPGCCNYQWLCTYKYRWSDNSELGPFTECNTESCIQVIEL